MLKVKSVPVLLKMVHIEYNVFFYVKTINVITLLMSFR